MSDEEERTARSVSDGGSDGTEAVRCAMCIRCGDPCPHHRRESASPPNGFVPIEQWDAAEDRIDALAVEVLALRKVAEAARDVWKVCDEAPSFYTVNEIVIERRLSDLEEALHELDVSESSRGGSEGT